MKTNNYILLKELIDYDPIAGTMKWKRDHCRNKKGDEVGRFSKYGVKRVSINSISYSLRRVAWFICHGVVPKRIYTTSKHRDNIQLKNLTLNSELAAKASKTAVVKPVKRKLTSHKDQMKPLNIRFVKPPKSRYKTVKERQDFNYNWDLSKIIKKMRRNEEVPPHFAALKNQLMSELL